MTKYRPEIDGLRCVAVMAVVFHHAQLTLFSGGFVGVDIFFVISGYLITKIFLQQKNKLNIKDFFTRRIRRIFPSIFFLSIFSLIIAVYVMPPSYLLYFSQLLRANSLFVSNIFLSKLNYFSPSNEMIPFLHTWSLSIEEQFYIIYPIIFFLFKKKNFLKILLIGTLFSFFLSVFAHNLSYSYPFYKNEFYFFDYDNKFFFNTFCRTWELGSGALVAIFFKNRSNKIISFVGIIFIIFSILFFDKNTPYSGIFVIIPVLGTSLVIIFIDQKTHLYRLLASRLFVSIGLISYGVYLYHYPVITFLNYIKIYYEFKFHELIYKFGIIIGSLTLGLLNYFIIEKPFRDKTSIISKDKFLLLFFTLGTAFIVLISSYIINNNGMEKRYLNRIQIYKNIFITNDKIIEEKENYINKFYKEKFNTNKKKVLIIGDSYSRDFFLTIDNNEEINKKYEVAYYFEKTQKYNFNFKWLKERNKFVDFQKKKLTDSSLFKSADIILVAYRFTDPNIIHDINNFFKIYRKNFIIIGSHPEFNFRDPVADILIKKNYTMEKKEIEEKLFINQDKKFLIINNKLKDLSKNLNISYFDRYNIICDFYAKKCLALTDNFCKIYINSDHYTLCGASYLGELYFGKKIKFLLDRLD
jgi:peptidoglycan/LPS O-acetylase OafA/YrhL